MADFARSSPHRLVLVSMLFGFSAISYFDRIIMTAAGPQMMHDFGLSTTAMGRVYSAFILGYALMMIPAGRIADGIGGRAALALMGFGSVVFTVLTALTGSLIVPSWIGTASFLIGVRFGLGLVTAPLYPACACVVRTSIPTTWHARVQGLIIAGSSLGAAISPLAFTSLLSRYNWRTPLFAAALAPAALAVIWLWCTRGVSLAGSSAGAAAEAPVVRRPTPWITLFTDRNLILLTSAYGALGYFQYIFFYWMYYYFDKVLHFGQEASARYIALLFLVEGAVMPIGGWASDRLSRERGLDFGRRWVPITALSLAGVLTYAGIVTVGFGAVACFSLAFGLSACCEGPFWAAVTEIGGEHVGSASSLLNTGAQVGGFFAPLLTPIIAERFGWSKGLYAAIAAVFCGALAVYFIKMRPMALEEETLPVDSPATPLKFAQHD